MRVVSIIGGILAGVIVSGAVTFLTGSQIATHTSVFDDDIPTFIDSFFASLVIAFLIGGALGGWIGYLAAGRFRQER